MHQIRIHGRGGQGVVTAAELIAIAAFKGGKQAQAFPSFGVERSGAPIEAFARISDKPIRIREHVYEPDIVIVLDATLLNSIDVMKGTKPDAFLILNTTKKSEEVNIGNPEKIFTVDATKIALKTIGKNITNTIILGAFSKVSGLISLDNLEKAIEEKFKEKGKETVEKNKKAIKEAYAQINQ